MKTKLITKLAGGLLAIAVAVTAIAGGPTPASADGQISNPNITPCKLGLCPDLAVVELRPKRVSETHVEFTITIKNVGTVPAAAGTWTVLYRDFVSEKVWVEGQLAPGQSQTRTVQHYLPKTAAMHTVSGQVDANNDINELSDANNFVTVSFQ